MLARSLYNVILPEGNEVLIFNTHSLYFGRLPASLYHEAEDLIFSLNTDTRTLPQSDEVRQIAFELRHRGFFVDDPEAERAAVTARFNVRKNTRDHLGLTIAPTDACNFACPYCYEHLNHRRMSEEMQRRVASFIEEELAAGKYQSMHVTWYGGEPLLPESLRAITFLSERIMAACAARSITYSANIISNGYLLTRKTAARLAALNVGLMQVTLDGPRLRHDQTRILKNGAGTFDRILSNIKTCLDLMRFSIRMNVSADNRENVADLKRVLQEEGILADRKRTTFYVSPVRSYTTTCQNGVCLSNEAFYRLQLDLLKTGINADGFAVVEEFPVAKESICTAVGADSFVIGPDGDLYKCWLDLGRREFSVGCVGNGGLELNDRITRWHDFRPFDQISCASCIMLPICMGGCPELNMRSSGREENQACCNWKYILDDHLRYLARGV